MTRGIAPWRRREARAAWLFLTPALLTLAVFFVLPVVAAFLISFTDFDLYALADPGLLRFVGLENYRTLLHDPLFWQALRNTFFFVAVGVPLALALSLAAAVLLHSRLTRWPDFFRTVYFAPVVTTLVAVAAVWRYLYHPRAGLLNAMLGWFGVAPIDWLGDSRWAMFALVVLATWKNFGYGMVLFLAGLRNVPAELLEAARIDGANGWQRFRHVTLPSLRPIVIFVSTITLIGYFQVFAEPYVMTRGGPGGSTLSLNLFMYQEGFRWWRMGYASSIAFVLFLIVLSATLLQGALQRERA